MTRNLASEGEAGPALQFKYATAYQGKFLFLALRRPVVKKNNLSCSSTSA